MNNMTEMDHPAILRGLKAVDTPIVQEIIKQLSQFGLAVALPHSHGKKGNFLPLPDDTVTFESHGQISFPEKDSPALDGSVPVMWRWDNGTQTVGACANCDKVGQH